MLTKTARIATVGALAVMIGVTALPSTVRAADAIGFGDQGQSATFGANAIIRIDGSITYDSNCPDPGIDDFFYPATDVYIVPAGTTGGELQDAGGGRPNTIVSGASAFVDEVIAVTAPAGQLDEGVYDVVYDTCQDGVFDAGRDTVFPNAIAVALPEVLPLADAAITALKDEARDEYYSWLATRFAMKGLFKLADQAIKVQCTAGNSVGCAMKKLDYFGGIKERFLGLLLSQSNHYLAIAEDPPDPNYETLTEVGPIEIPVDHTDSALGNAIADSVRPLAGETAVSAALLDAVERYQGAQAAGDGEWALVHARQASNLAATLRELVGATDLALGNVRTASGTVDELEEQLGAARQFAGRVWNSGFTPDERRTLANQGRSAGEIAALETELRTDLQLGVDAAHVQGALDQARALRPATATAAAASAAEWGEIVVTLEAELDAPGPRPAIDAGGPYTTDEGAELALAGAAAGTIESAMWDLDADGEFDDANGLTPTVSIDAAGAHIIGLRVSAEGADSVSYAVASVADVNRPPVVASASPAERGTTIVIGSPRQFSLTAGDPDGDDVAYSWTLDGTDVGVTGESWMYDPATADVGEHVVEVVASDGTTSGGVTRRAWTVQVIDVDADGDGWTATPDCDDDDPAIHPTADELLGNGIDDDCDSGTPDAPPVGLTGSLWSWGSNHNGTVGTGSFSPTVVQSPVQVPPYDDVAEIAIGDRAEYAVLASGEVRDWGFGLTGNLGNGTLTTTATHQSPLAVGGGAGTLSGVTQLSASGHVLARRSDGSVVAWGENQARAVGDGSTVNYRLYPVEVLTGPNGPALGGVRAVHAGYVESYALMDDGTVKAWGTVRCDGGTNIRIEPFPITLGLLGGDVRQISSGNQWTMFLKKDGTVLSCGTVPPRSGRPTTIADIYVPKPVTGLGAGSGVIDIAAGYESGLALKADGSVWQWGYNGNGSLHAIGVPGGGSAPAPVQVPLPPGPPVVDIEMHNACHALAIRADGSVLSWGCDFFGQGGDGETGDAVVDTPTVLSLPGSSAIKIINSTWNSLVLTRPVADPEWERPATWVDASVADASVAESGGHFTVELSDAVPQDVTVHWSLAAGTAGAEDVALEGATATIPAGATSVDIALPVIDDSIDEDDEAVTIVLGDISHGIQFARSQATGTIVDDDAPPTVSAAPVAVVEGNTSLTDAVVPVTLSAPSAKPITVDFATVDGEAVSPDDFAPASGRIEFQPGQQRVDVHVMVRGDHLAEPSEHFSLVLTQADNATLATGEAAVTINDDEPLTLTVVSPEVAEGDDGTSPATLTVAVEPTPPAGTTVTVDYAVAGVTAGVPADVSPSVGTLVFESGGAPQSVTAEVVGDLEQEGDEAFRLALSNLAASDGRLVLVGEISPAKIVDDDTAEPDPDPDPEPEPEPDPDPQPDPDPEPEPDPEPDPADTIAPVTTATTDSTPSETGWYRHDVTVRLVASDEGGSGVQHITYDLSGAQTGQATVAGAEATVAITAEGSTTITYFAQDMAGNIEAARTFVVRIDRTAPSVSCSANPGVLWPPSHQLVPVKVTVGVQDASSGAIGFVLTGVTSSEPDDAVGDGDGSTKRDVQGFEVGTADTAGLLRAERAGTGSGRTYTLTYVARDGASNESTCITKMIVPHSNGSDGGWY